MKKVAIITLVLLLVLLCSFHVKNNALIVEQVGSDLPIIIRYDSVRGCIFRIQFPLVYRIRNLSGKDKKIERIAYFYEDEKFALTDERGWNSTVLINQIKKGEIISAYRRGRIIVDSLETKDFVIQTGHSIPCEDTIQSLFEPYISKLKTSHKDTLHIGTIQVFQTKYPGIMDQFMKNDSIQFWIGTLWGEEQVEQYILPIGRK